MSDQPKPEVSGPPMLAMTSALRPPPARISKIGENMTLPFSVQIDQLVATVVGAILTLIFVTIFFVPFLGGSIVLFGGALGIGGTLGLLTVTWSPLRGESLKTWLGLNLYSSRKDKVEINGMPARAYIGIAPLHCSASGQTHIVSGAVNVPPGTVDDRGVLVPLRETLPRFNTGVRRLPGPEDGFDNPKNLQQEGSVTSQNRGKVLRRQTRRLQD